MQSCAAVLFHGLFMLKGMHVAEHPQCQPSCRVHVVHKVFLSLSMLVAGWLPRLETETLMRALA
jgi:hypothetical protein